MLTDLRDTLDAPILKLPIGGTVYEVTECDAATWLRLQEVNQANIARVRAREAGAAVPDDDIMSEMEMVKLSLSDAYQTMIDGGVRPSELRHAGVTAFYWQLGVEDLAVSWWESGGKAPAPPGPSRSTSTRTRAAKSSTASRTSTTPRKRSPAKKAG
jgi:hypothetical protein